MILQLKVFNDHKEEDFDEFAQRYGPREGGGAAQKTLSIYLHLVS